MVHLDVSKVWPSGPVNLTIWNESKQGMINQYSTLNKVCFVAKTKIDGMRCSLCTNEFCVKMMTKNHTNLRHNAFLQTPLEHCNT